MLPLWSERTGNGTVTTHLCKVFGDDGARIVARQPLFRRNGTADWARLAREGQKERHRGLTHGCV